jgi:hypothetical protein
VAGDISDHHGKRPVGILFTQQIVEIVSSDFLTRDALP